MKKKSPVLTSYETRQLSLINTNYGLLYEKTTSFAFCGDTACSLSLMGFPAFQKVRQVHMVPVAVFCIKKQITVRLKILDF